MLDDLERRALAQIDAWFEANDPALAQRLARGPAMSPARRFVLATAAGMVVTMVGYLVTAIAGTAAGIAAALTVAIIMVGIRLQRRPWRRRCAPSDEAPSDE